MKPMVPSGEKRAIEEFASFAADGFFEIQPDAAERNIRHVKRLEAAFETTYRDGHAAGFAAALAMLEPIIHAKRVTLGPNTASYPADGSYSEFRPPMNYFDNPTQAARVAYWFESWDDCVAFDQALHAAASALADIAEKEPHPPLYG